MDGKVGQWLRFVKHCRTAGPGEAKRRIREKAETERIRAELARGPELTPEERKTQAAALPRAIRFEIILPGKNADGKAREEALSSLREQTYTRFEIGETDGETAEDYAVFMDEDGWLHPGALYEIAKAICETGAEFLYTDEDFFTALPARLNRPWCKPGYGPDTMRGCEVCGAFFACSKALLKEAGAEGYAGMSPEERWDAVIRMAAAAARVERIPKILFYRRVPAGETFLPAVRRVQDPIKGEPLVSILIPNKDHREDLARCIDSIREKTTWPKWEIIVIENNSEDEETFRYYEEIGKDERIRVIRREGRFNYSAVNNAGFREAKGEQILLLNNDTEVVSPDWIQEMLMYAQREDVGAVGAKLYYPDGTIQHAGIGIGIKMLAGHYFRGETGDSEGYYGRLSYAQEVSAVTAACMMIPRRVYEEMHGLDESFSVVFNDVDLCLRIREAGYNIVWTPWAELTHYESKSRGADEDTEEKKRFFVGETNRFLRKWYRVLEEGDPYYNPNLTRDKEDFSLR